MFIKEINITGFRSYRELTTVRDFSCRHNVVVGRNGSGKSNFFYAIQFLLSSEYHTIKQEERNNILHEGTGNRSTFARVEVVFDNTDRRISTDSNEVRIVRQVGLKKDQFFIDNRPVQKQEIVNLMESVGFSRSNPYYIVKQGKITELATASDAYRLQLIREVAGTRVFDEKKTKSLNLLAETQHKIQRSIIILNSMEQRLQKLEEEKEDLKEYQKWDKMKRAIEYTIYNMEVKEVHSKCDKLAAQREQINAQQNAVETELISTKLALQNVETDIRKLDVQYRGKRKERKQLADEQTECLQKKTQLELFIKDLKDDVDRERSGRAQAENNLLQLRAEIRAREEELARLAPEYARLAEEESQLYTDIRIAKQRCKELNAKRGHLDQFHSIEERDRHLKREINFLNRQIDENNDRIQEIQRSMEQDESEILKLQETSADLELKVQESLTQIDSLSTQSRAKKQQLDRAIAVQMENAREEKQAREQQTANQYEIAQAEQDLQRLASKAIINGVNSVKTVLAQLKEDRRNAADSRKLIDGYYGCVIELLECDNKYHKAIEVTAESRLFFHVVENDQVATKLLEYINDQQLPGEVNFYPLNRVVAKPRRNVNDSDARPMLTEMRYDEKFDAVFTIIFANTVFVRNLEAGSRVSRNERFDCVTLEGDKVSRRGPMTGGFIDAKKSKLELAKAIRSLKDVGAKYEERVEYYAQKTNDCTSDVERIRLELNKIEMDRATLSHEHRLLTERARSIAEQINQLVQSREPKSAQLLQLRGRVREIQARKQTFVDQLGTALDSQMSSQEQELIDKLQFEIREKKNQLEKVARDKTKIESNKMSLENQLQSNLLKKRKELTAKIQDISVKEMCHTLTLGLAEVKMLNERIDRIMRTLGELDENLTEYEKEKESLTTQLETLQEQKNQLSSQIDEFAKEADVLCTKISSIQSKREETLQKMRDMGSLPADALGAYQNQSIKQLNRMLTECMKELNKYENVNKKALDQFAGASGQKEELTKRLEELIVNETSIKDLLEVLENKRYETLQLTFKQVAKNFHDLFQKLIPHGNGNLVMKTSADTSRDSVTGEEKRHIMESFVGIGIQVSFSGSSQHREMSHLSGGQKSLVALALIFAIQKCDPAPFYLFDEIDAALDAEHRKSVADVIHELSDSAQFITTTFRPELLQHAEKFYGVRFRNKVSYIDEVTREEAYDFIQDDHTRS